MTESQAPLTPGSLGGLTLRKASEKEHKPCIMLYGQSSIGKTSLACSACEVPELSPVLHLDLEQGALSVSEVYPDIISIEVPTIKHLQGIFNDLFKQDGAGFRTVIVDNATEQQKMDMEYLFGVGSSGTPTDFVDFASAEWNDPAWGKNSEHMRKSVRYFRRLPMNVIFTAWAKDFSSGKKGEVPDIRPAFSKTVAGEVPGLFNDVYYYSMKNGVRILQTSMTDTCLAKDRTRKLPPVIKNPTMQIIHDYWTGKEVYKPESNSKPNSTPTVNIIGKATKK